MEKRGFTLIEVMVVLSILAIIAILGYNFFGSTMKEATLTQSATEVARQISVLSDAFDEYYRKTGAKPGTNATFKANLLSSGVLKSYPQAPLKWNDPAFVHALYAPGSDPGWYTQESADVAGGAGDDYVLALLYVKEDICLEFNKRYSSVGASIPTNFTLNMNTMGPSVCFRSDPAGHHLFYSLLEVK